MDPEGLLVREESHQDFVCRERESLKAKQTLLRQEIQVTRSSIWAETNSRQSPLIPGLPDDIVEGQIWPRLKNYFETTVIDTYYMQYHDNWTNMQKKLFSCIAVSLINKKWRFLSISSKPWQGIKLIGLQRHRYLDKLRYSTPMFLFWFYMRILPPLDNFSILPSTCILRWLKAWVEYDREERDILLQLYPDEQGKLHQDRLAIWKHNRDLKSSHAYASNVFEAQ